MQNFNRNFQIKLETAILKWSLCNYDDAHILLEEITTTLRKGVYNGEWRQIITFNKLTFNI